MLAIWLHAIPLTLAEELVTDAERQALTVLEARESEELDGISVEWTSEGGNLVVTVLNERPAPIQVDWNQSAFTDPTGLAVGVVPGSTMKMDVHRVVAPSLVPPGASVRELVVRESAVDIGSDTVPLVSFRDAGAIVAVTLAIVTDGQTTWIAQPFDVGFNQPELDALKAKRTYEANLRSWVTTQRELKARRGKGLRQAVLFASAGVGGAILCPASGAIGENGEFSPPGFALGVAFGLTHLAAGGSLAAWRFGQYLQAEEDLKAMEPKPVAP